MIEEETTGLLDDSRKALDRWYSGDTDSPHQVVMYAENLRARVEELERALKNGDRLLSQAGRRVEELERWKTGAIDLMKAEFPNVNRAEAERDTLARAIRVAMDNIGVPGDGYPASIAFAYHGLSAALASLDKNET